MENFFSREKRVFPPNSLPGKAEYFLLPLVTKNLSNYLPSMGIQRFKKAKYIISVDHFTFFTQESKSDQSAINESTTTLRFSLFYFLYPRKQNRSRHDQRKYHDTPFFFVLLSFPVKAKPIKARSTKHHDTPFSLFYFLFPKKQNRSRHDNGVPRHSAFLCFTFFSREKKVNGALSAIRTHDLLLRRELLCPAEL